MSSVIISGDSSGSVTLQAPAVAGSTVVNLPASSMNIGNGGGSVATNTAFGASALAANSTGSNITAVGSGAYALGTASANDAFGQGSMGGGIVTGVANAAFGRSSLNSLTSGTLNTAIGSAAMELNTTGSSNTAVGRQALFSNTTASNNTAVGYQSGYSGTTATDIVALGYKALYANTNNGNTAVGSNAMVANTTGYYNAVLGTGSLSANTTGALNVAIGYAALLSNTTASQNTALGYQSGYSNTTSAGNTYLGYVSGYSATGSYNTFVGWGAGNNMTTGSKNTIIGAYAGNQGGLDIRTASNYIVLSDGDGNPRGIFDGSGNFLVGATTTSLISTNTAGTAIKVAGGVQLMQTANTSDWGIKSTSGSVCNFYSWNGAAAVFAGSINVNGNVTTYTSVSDIRLKENIADAESASSLIDSLQVRKFDWKSDNSHQRYGFIAQELVTVAPEAVHQPEDTEQMMAVDYSKLVPMLVKEIQSLRARVAQLESN